LRPIVMISSWPPRLCGIATFAEEACEFISSAHPERPLHVISHTDGQSDFPVIDMSRRDWWRPVVDVCRKLNPWVIHVQHEYGLYEYHDERGRGDGNAGFLEMLDQLREWPLVVEPHTVHGRLHDYEADFLYKMTEIAHVVFVKCHYQKWRMAWTFSQLDWPVPTNVMVIPHGARPDRRWGPEAVPRLRQEIGLDKYPYIGQHLVGLVGWIQANKRWDILTSIWEECAAEIQERTGQQWDLLAAGKMRDPHDQAEYQRYKQQVNLLEKKGLAHYYEFIPRGKIYYKVMAVCDFIVLPTVDETQSGTLARIIAMNKPYITTAPMEGLTAQTLESEGGLLFTNQQMLKAHVIRMACDEQLRMKLGNNLRKYLDEEVSWEVVARQYSEAYAMAQRAVATGEKVQLPAEF